MVDWREDRIGAAHRGENPMVMARMRTGFAVIVLGEAVAAACADNPLRRINYEILGNSLDWLHGHVHAR